MNATRTGITRFSPAKVNLTLAVGPIRPDGYHPLESIVARLDFGDHVTLSPREDDRIVIECDAQGIPKDDTNLAARAARRLREELTSRGGGRLAGVTISLEKSIPAGAGLGGGSSNAAATLLGLRQLWNVDVPAVTLAAIAAEIGSDVPLFLADPGMIVMRGRGEEIELIGHAPTGFRVLLAIPPIHSPTGAVYKRFDALPAPPTRPPARTILAAILRPPAGRPLLNAMGLFNDLQQTAESVNPALREFRESLTTGAGQDFLMTGSGAAYITLFSRGESERAETVKTALQTANAAARFILTRLI